jgi:hypothetical protein
MFAEMPFDNRAVNRIAAQPPPQASSGRLTSPLAKRPNVSSRLIVL